MRKYAKIEELTQGEHKQDPNATVMNDTLIIKITAGYGKLAATEELVVINEAIPVILFQPDKLIFMNAGGTETVLVAANQAWQLVLPYTGSWSNRSPIHPCFQ